MDVSFFVTCQPRDSLDSSVRGSWVIHYVSNLVYIRRHATNWPAREKKFAKSENENSWTDLNVKLRVDLKQLETAWNRRASCSDDAEKRVRVAAAKNVSFLYK